MTTREVELRKEVDNYPDAAIGNGDVAYIFTLLDTERAKLRKADWVAEAAGDSIDGHRAHTNPDCRCVECCLWDALDTWRRC